MMPPPANSDPRQSARDVAGDASSVAEALGANLVAQVDLDAITALIQGLPTMPLLEQLDAVVAALDSADPVRARRRAGWLGRLMGRDLVARAQADPLEQRVRVALSAAQAHAAALASRLPELQAAADALQTRLEQLDATVCQARASEPADDPSVRRRLHLELIATSWTATLAHVGMVREYASRLLQRHEQVRDVLVPLWRQHAAARAASAQLRSDDRPDQFTRLQHELRAGLASLHESADRLPQQIHTIAVPTKEPLP